MATLVPSMASAGTAVEGGLSRRVLFALAVLAGVVAGLGLVAVIGAGFALSFSAISTVARASGIGGGLAWLLPAAIDGAMSVATVTAVVVRRMDRSTVYPWTVVLVNAAFSVAGNALHAYAGSSLTLPHTVAVSVSAIPALNLALSVHLLVTLVDSLADVLKRCAGSSGQVRDPEGATPIDRQERQQTLTPRCVPAPVRPKVVAADAEPDNVVVTLTSPDPKNGGERRREATDGRQVVSCVARRGGGLSRTGVRMARW